MSSQIFDQWVRCLRAFDALSPPGRMFISHEVGKKYFREELLVWGTQEVLPDIFSGKRSLDDGNLRGKMMKRSLTAILENLQILKNGDQYGELKNAAAQQNVSSQALRQASNRANRRASRFVPDRDGKNPEVNPSGVYDISSRDKQKFLPNDESSSDSDSSVASDGPMDTVSRGDITDALDRLFKLASFGANYILPTEDECPEFFETPGAEPAFPRAWRLISDKFPKIENNARMLFAVLLSISLSTMIRNQKGFPFQPETASRRGIQDISKQLPSVSGLDSGPPQYVLRRSTLTSGHESKRSPSIPYTCTFFNCLQSYQIFPDEADFLTHLEDMHRHERIEVRKISWVCSAVVHENNIPYFESGEELRKHFNAEHKDLTDDGAIENLISISIRTQTPVHPAAWCTVCNAPVQREPGSLFRADYDLMQEFPAHIHSHVAELLHEAMQEVRDLKESDVLSNLLAKRGASIDENSRDHWQASAQKRRRAK